MRILLFILPAIFSFSSSFAQGTNIDSLTDIQVKNVIGEYNNYTKENAPIYNGTAYIYYTFRMEGDPFFQHDDLSNGWLSYRGIKYDPLSLLFDLMRNQVVVLFPDSNSRAVLDNDFIDSFRLAGHTFISLKEDHQQNLYNTAFYDLLYKGHIQLLARRTKIMKEDLSNNPVITIISPKDFFYVHRKGLYYLVTNKKEVFRLFADKKREIKKMMRQQGLEFNRNTFESTLISVVTFYDQNIH